VTTNSTELRQDTPARITIERIAGQTREPLRVLRAEIGLHATNLGHAALNLKEMRKGNRKQICKKNIVHASTINEN
jgi:hypothetical protein